jgi:DNA repair protein RecO (recombination protein O)
MSLRSYSTTGIILKRSDVGEADRIVTLFTREYGKLTAIAKGCRKLSSSRGSSLEPGTFSKVHLVKTKSLPILTQAQLINDFSKAKQDLTSMRKVFEVLEMLDSLLIEEDAQEQVFALTNAIFEHLSSDNVRSSVVRDHLSSIIETLGFGERSQIDFSKPLRDFVEEITQHKLKAYAFLTQP